MYYNVYRLGGLLILERLLIYALGTILNTKNGPILLKRKINLSSDFIHLFIYILPTIMFSVCGVAFDNPYLIGYPS